MKSKIHTDQLLTFLIQNELFDLGERGDITNMIHKGTLPLVGIGAKAQLGTPLLPGAKNGLIGQVMNLAATPEGFNMSTYLQWLNPTMELLQVFHLLIWKDSDL